jgi:uncharacterized protein (UPF0303 family)
LFDKNYFEISEPQSLAGYGDALDIMVHNNIRISNVIVSDILDSDHLTAVILILDHVRTEKDSWDDSKNLQTWSGFKA